MCRLLAMAVAQLQAQAKGGAGRARRFLEGYDPPSVDLAAALEEAGTPVPARASDPAERAAQIMAVIQAAGGEAG